MNCHGALDLEKTVDNLIEDKCNGLIGRLVVLIFELATFIGNV